MSIPERITLKAFRAPDEPTLCDEFIREHRRVLEDFGIANVTTNNDRWTRDPFCYVIVALHERLGMVGGIRLEIAKDDIPLPMELALMKFDATIHDALEELRPYGNGEVCGLWNANRYANKGIPLLLSHAITALAVPAGARRMVCLVAHYTKKHPSRNGFVVMEDLGDKGTFSYPIPSITAVAMMNPDTMLLDNASESQRHLIYSLRLRPRQVRLEQPGDTLLEVEYDMMLKGNLIDIYSYQQIHEERLRNTA
jgi:hypothetical protein